MSKTLGPGFDHPENIPLDEHGNIVADVKCLVCGYNLRTQSINGRCPECGTAVGRTAHGDLLRYCDPAWVEMLSSGMNWIVAGIILGFILGILGGAISAASAASKSGEASSLQLVLTVIASIIGIIGYWKLTTPDPDKPGDVGVNARSVGRYGYLSSTALTLMGSFLALAGPELFMIVGCLYIVGTVVSLVGMFAVFIYVRRLALRIPNENLAFQTQIVMYGIGASMAFASFFGGVLLFSAGSGKSGASLGFLGGGACVAGAGMLVFGIWALILIFRYRRAFEGAAKDARSTWAASAGS